MEIWAQIKDLDWSMVGSDRQMSSWPSRIWPMEKHYHHIGHSGGFGLGYNLSAAVGAALANRAHRTVLRSICSPTATSCIRRACCGRRRTIRSRC